MEIQISLSLLRKIFNLISIGYLGSNWIGVGADYSCGNLTDDEDKEIHNLETLLKGE